MTRRSRSRWPEPQAEATYAPASPVTTYAPARLSTYAPAPDGRRLPRRVRAPPILRRDLRLDVYVLGVLERLQALLAELAAEPGLLHAAERPGVVVGQRIVDPHGAGSDLTQAADRSLEVARVDVRAEAEAG